MMNNVLDTPIFNEASVRSVNFFNGRLLSAEDLNKEKLANLEGRKQVGQAMGDGVAYGLEVSLPESAMSASVTVQPGLAINRRGRTLSLYDSVTLALQPPVATGTPPRAAGSFDDCLPPQSGVYIVNEGIYLLTIAPSEASEGRAQVSGLGNGAAACNVRYTIEAVQFRLINLTDFFVGDLGEPAKLRNRVAHRCFGSNDARLNNLMRDPFGTAAPIYGLLDDLRATNRLTRCEVPIAVLHWTRPGIQFVDIWAVRRRITDPAATRVWSLSIADRHMSEGEAMFLQFQAQLADPTLALTGLQATNRFLFLPPAGYLPTSGSGFTWPSFLGPLAPNRITPVDTALLRAILRRALLMDAIAVGSATAVNVYQDPAQPGFVLFARAEQGRIRIVTTPKLNTNAVIQLTAQPDRTSTQLVATWQGETNAGQSYLVDVPPGPCAVRVNSAGVMLGEPVAVTAIGGEIQEITIDIPNGGLLINVVDLAGTVISAKVSSVAATGGGITRPGLLSTDQTQWVIGDLPANTYTLTVVATGYQTTTVANLVLQQGHQLRQTVALTPVKVRTQPPICLTLRHIEKPALEKVRLCMVLKATEFTGKFFNDFYAVRQGLTLAALNPVQNLVFPAQAEFAFANVASLPTLVAGKQATFSDQFTVTDRISSSLVSKAISKQYYVDLPERPGRPKITEHPWTNMLRIDPLPAEAPPWLAEWQTWFNEEFPGQGIDRAQPAIFIAPDYRVPAKSGDVPKQPQAYAVFGDFGIPLSITISTSSTKRAVLIDKGILRGVSDKAVDYLKDASILYVDQIPGLWSDFLDEVLLQAPDDSRYLIDDGRTAVEQIRTTRSYLDGVDETVAAQLVELGYTDDVALANADFDKLSTALNSKGLANRLVKQAREIVASASWSLSQLGLTSEQTLNLHKQGVTSMGELASKASTAEGQTVLKTALGDNDTLIENLHTSALSQITEGSIGAFDKSTLFDLTAIQENPAVGQKLAQAGFASIDNVASAEVSDLQKAGLSESEATTLRDRARQAGASGADVSMLSSVSQEAANVLKGQGIGTVFQLANANVDAIANAFGGNVKLANAVIRAAQSGLRFTREE